MAAPMASLSSRSTAPRHAAGSQARAPARQGLAARAPAHLLPGSRNPLAQPRQLQHHQQQQHLQRGGALVARGLFGLGLPEIAVIAGVAALIFGPSKLPELGKGLGKTVKSFQVAANEFKSELEAATKDDAAAPGSSDDAAAAKKDGSKSE